MGRGIRKFKPMVGNPSVKLNLNLTENGNYLYIDNDGLSKKKLDK